MTGLKLHEFQKQAIAAIEKDREAGHRNCLAVIPTGGGKTIIGLQYAINYIDSKPGARVLWLAHLRDLIYQPVARVGEFWPKYFPHTGIVMADTNQASKQIVVATVQTLSRKCRLEQLLESGPIDVIIADEAHHSTGDRQKNLFRRLREANPGLFHLGLTATPGDKATNGLGEVYDVTSVNIPLTDLIAWGLLATPRFLAIQTGIDLSGLKPRRNVDGVLDYVDTQLADVYEVDNCFDLVVESHVKYGADRQFIAFVSSVAGAEALAGKFAAAGIPTACGSAKTPKKQRAGMLNGIRSGELRGLVNVGIWTEGLDLPMISLIHLVRPTKNDDLYMQMVGRALRIFIGKVDALLLDYVPEDSRELVRFGDVLGIPRVKQKWVADTKRGDVESDLTYDGEIKWLIGDPQELIHRQLEYLSASPWRWSGKPDQWKVLGLGRGRADNIERTLAVSPYAPDGICHLWALWRRPKQDWKVAPLLSTEEFDEIESETKRYAMKWSNSAISGKSQKWHQRAPSEATVAYAKRLGISDPESMSQGDLDTAMTRTLAVSALRRYDVYDNPSANREEAAA